MHFKTQRYKHWEGRKLHFNKIYYLKSTTNKVTNIGSERNALKIRLRVNSSERLVISVSRNRQTWPTKGMSSSIKCFLSINIIASTIQFSSFLEINPTLNKKHSVQDWKEVVNKRFLSDRLKSSIKKFSLSQWKPSYVIIRQQSSNNISNKGSKVVSDKDWIQVID